MDQPAVSSPREDKCPVCLSTDLKNTFSITCSESAQHFVIREGNPERHIKLAAHIDRLWGNRPCSISVCRACGFSFANPFVAGDMEFYSLAFERASYPSEKWDYSFTIEQLSQLQFKADRILEIGAGFGFFLDKVANRFVPASGISATEYGAPAVAKLRSKGYRVCMENIRTAGFAPGFDAIFIFQVVEHLDNIHDLFGVLSFLLKPGGSLILTVPNRATMELNESIGRLLDMPPAHIGRWSEQSLRRIGEQFGLSLEKTAHEPINLRKLVPNDLGSYYMRQMQIPGTLANWSRRYRSRRGGKLLGLAVVLLMVPFRIPVWIRTAALEKRLGGSIWARFVKV